MRSRSTSGFLAASLCAAVGTTLPAQTVTAIATAPLTVSATSGVAVTNGTFPAGPMTTFPIQVSAVGSSISQAIARIQCSSEATPHHLSGSLTVSGYVGGPDPGSTQAHGNDIVMALALPQPTDVAIELRFWAAVSAGTPMPTLRIDVDNDGTYELTESSLPTTTVFRSVGPTPLLIRMQVDGGLSTFGSLSGGISFEAKPLFTTAVRAFGGCGAAHDARPRFDGGLDLYFSNIVNGSWTAGVGVVGLGVQPLLLGSIANLPCVVLPSPDLVVFVPFTPPFAPSLTIPLPPAVRPVTLWSQNVQLDAAGLMTSDAFRTDAQ